MLEPYDLDGLRILFSHFPRVLEHCCRSGGSQSAARTLDLAILLPGDRVKYGQSTDGQLLPELIPELRALCAGCDVELNLETRIAWECDLPFLQSSFDAYERDVLFLEDHHQEDLRQYFKGIAPEKALARMKDNHEHLLHRARETLGSWNLLLVGSPKVNPVVANLCDVLQNQCSLERLAFRLQRRAHDSALVLQQYREDAGGVASIKEYREDEWKDRDVGWLQLLRSPWAPAPRFVLHLGGFYSQGTPAALRQLIRICRDLSRNPNAPAGKWLAAGFDLAWRQPPPTPAMQRGERDFVPAHVVEADVDMPWCWFVHTPRQTRSVHRPRFLTPPSYQGTVRRLKEEPTPPPLSGPGEAAYLDPQGAAEYTNPTHIGDHRLQLARLPELFSLCSRDGRLDLAIILPGNLQKHGQSTDVQLLPELADELHRVCEECRLSLNLVTRLSWECDARLLETFPDEDQVFRNALRQADCSLYFPTLSRHAAYERMCARQRDFAREAKSILGGYNLIVVGSPKVNRVMRNLCTVFARNYASLGAAGMYLHADEGDQPLQLCRFQGRQPTNDQVGCWLRWQERDWRHVHVGWLHLIRNPWSAAGDRFLIYLGGIHAQGTPAAMRRLIEVSRQVRAGNTATADHQWDPGQTLPAHVVEALVSLPWGWFLTAPRPGLAQGHLWTRTPPSFEGSITDVREVDLSQADGGMR